MLGAIIGDIVGSRFEWNNHRNKDFELFSKDCFPTDDSIMTLAVADAIICCRGYENLSDMAVKKMREIGRLYPNCGYGRAFYQWIYSDDPKPYFSYGNGAAMRVSACGYAAKNLEGAKELSRKVTQVTHNHPEGLKGAEAVTVCIFMALHGYSISEIKNHITKNYYPINFTLDDIRQSYKFNVTCQDTVPQALEAFFESADFEDAIRNAISIGGDSDTIAAISGSVAEAYYGIPEKIKESALHFLDEKLRDLLYDVEKFFNREKLKNMP